MLVSRSRSRGMPSEFVSRLSGVDLHVPQKKHLVAMMESLIVTQGPKTTKALAKTTLDGCDRSSLSRHLSSSWQPEAVLASGRQFWHEHWGQKSGMVYHIIDDTANPHSAKPCPSYERGNRRAMQGLDMHFDHTSGASIWAHSVVTSHVVFGGNSLPWKHQMYRRKDDCVASGLQFQSKIDIACAMIEQFAPPAGASKVCHLMDAWYSNGRVIDVVRARGELLVGGLSMKALVSYAPPKCGCEQKLSQLVLKLRPRHMESVTIRGKRLQYWRYEGKLFGRPDIVVLVVRIAGTTAWRAVVCSDLSLSSKEILKIYDMRWEIEVGHWYLKCTLGFSDYRLRSVESIQRFWCEVILTYWYLEWLRHKLKLHNLAEAQRHFLHEFETRKQLHYWRKLRHCKSQQQVLQLLQTAA